MQLTLKKGPQDLEARVVKPGLCCSCGGCMGLCPYFIQMHERVVLMEPCGLAEGRCYEVCPRSVVDAESLNQSVFGKARDDYALGTNKGVFMSRGTDEKVREKGQYGGTITSLIMAGMESGTIDGAILAGESGRYGLLPEPVLARTPAQVLAASGSKYTGCPTLKILDKSLRECSRLAVVGRPCQVISLRKRIAIEPEVGEKISLVLGLFCMWSLDYKDLTAYLADKIDMKAARKVDVPYNRFVVVTDEGARDLEYEPIKALRRETCDICFDFTSEFADISVGGTEWKEDWNTLISRTEKGAAAIEAAKAAGKLEVEPLPEERIELLRKASLGKKKRALQALASEEREARDYLVISQAEKAAVEKQG